jgi:hypothetical protein
VLRIFSVANMQNKAKPKAQNKAPRSQRVQNGMGRPRPSPGGQRSAPVAYGYTNPPVGMRSAAPTRPGSEVRFTGCDYLGSVSAITSAIDNSYALSAYAAGTFPRLTSVASIFEKYAWNKLRFYVVGKAASTLAGDMTSVCVYEGDTAGGAQLTESQAKNRFGQVTSKFWENHVMTIDCKKATVPWFTSTQVETNDATSNFGWYHLFTEAVAATTPVADVFVEYDVEFCDSKAAADVD